MGGLAIIARRETPRRQTKHGQRDRAVLAETKVVLHYDAGPWLIGRLRTLAAQGLAVDTCSERDDARFAKLMAEAEVLWHVLKPVTAEVMARAPRLRLVHKIGIGVNTIDLDAARERGIAVCNMPGTNSQAVAEMALLLMLASLRRILHFDRRTRAGQGWAIEPDLMERLGEIRGRRVGLVGFGAIPTLLAPWLKAMGADVVYTDVAARPGVEFGFLPLRGIAGDLRHRLAARAAHRQDRADDRWRGARAHEAGRDPGQYRARRPGRRAGADRGAQIAAISPPPVSMFSPRSRRRGTTRCSNSTMSWSRRTSPGSPARRSNAASRSRWRIAGGSRAARICCIVSSEPSEPTSVSA